MQRLSQNPVSIFPIDRPPVAWAIPRSKTAGLTSENIASLSYERVWLQKRNDERDWEFR